MPNLSSTPSPMRVAVVGAGIAGLACARTLLQAGCDVTVFESAAEAGGRLATRQSPFGGFDTGAQYFTVRDARFERALNATADDLARRWAANAVRVLDPAGRVIEAALPSREPHWVAAPGMSALPERWAQPLLEQGRLHLDMSVLQIKRDSVNPARWQLRTQGSASEHPVHAGFDRVVLALPPAAARILLSNSEHVATLQPLLSEVDVAPCWTLLLAYPNAAQPGLQTLGPQWNAARSTHHRVAWLTRESSKPARAPIERWTVQASAEWSRDHLSDSADRVAAKLQRAFSELTGIRATPAMSEAVLWREAQTTRPLGQPCVWNAALGVGLCGDWCLGHRVEDAFLSGLELALTLLSARG